jgi:PilZ domain
MKSRAKPNRRNSMGSGMVLKSALRCWRPSMRRFQYRAPRFPVDLPVYMTQGDSTQLTRCREVSVDGMKLDLMGASFPHSSGFIQLGDGVSSLKIPFQVSSRAIDSICVMFQNESTEASEALSRFIASLSHRQTCLSLVVLKPAVESGARRLPPLYS